MSAGFELIEPDDAVYADLSGRFADFNASQSTYDWRSFSIIQRDGDRIVAGGRGIINMGALEIRGLWVDNALRGQGIGAALMKTIEVEARRRGATRAMLYTYSWQAQAFYEKLGYREFSRFTYPDGPARIDLQKEL